MDIFREAAQDVIRGKSISQTSKKFGIPATSLRKYLKRNNIVSEVQKSQQHNLMQKDHIIYLRQKGLSYSEISRQTGVNVSSVMNWSSSIEITSDQQKHNLGGLVDKQKKAIEYREKGMYITEISELLNCAKSSVCLWLKQYVEKTGVVPGENIISNRKQEIKVKTISEDEKVFIENVLKKKKQGYSFSEISQETNIPIHKIQKAYNQANLSKVEKGKINFALRKRMRFRLDNGLSKPMGGDRLNSGWSKTGYYKSIYCGSTYELCWVIHALDHGVKFKRFEGVLKNNGTTYIPDFLLDDGVTIIELKGYDVRENVDKKTKLAESLGYQVNVLREKELQPMFDYVKQHYGVSWQKSYTLFDGFKPTYTYQCTNCSKEFATENKRPMKNGTVFCSGSCSATHRKIKFTQVL